jgi:enoyl-CoA hydratase
MRNGIAQELLAQTALFKTEDYQEARAAIREKRAPSYKGK